LLFKNTSLMKEVNYMKKVIVIIMCLTFGAILLMGCSESGEDNFEKKYYTSNGAEIAGLNIDVRDREIKITFSNDNQVHIDYFESDKEYYSIFVSNDKVLHMNAEDSKEWPDYIGGKTTAGNRKIYVQLPAALLKTLFLSTSNGDITLPSLTVTDSISISANGGNTTFDKLNAGNSIIIKSKNGDINGSVKGSYDEYSVESNIKKGESNLPPDKKGGDKILSVSNNNGNTNIDFVSQ